MFELVGDLAEATKRAAARLINLAAITGGPADINAVRTSYTSRPGVSLNLE